MGMKPKKQDAVPALPELRAGQSVELLKELHILTREGKLNQDSRRKLKQVYHLYQFIEKLLEEVSSAGLSNRSFMPRLWRCSQTPALDSATHAQTPQAETRAGAPGD